MFAAKHAMILCCLFDTILISELSVSADTQYNCGTDICKLMLPSYMKSYAKSGFGESTSLIYNMSVAWTEKHVKYSGITFLGQY